jgi:alpha-mannosidase
LNLSERLSSIITKLQQNAAVDILPLWQQKVGEDWHPITLNDRSIFTWEKGGAEVRLRQEWKIPQTLGKTSQLRLGGSTQRLQLLWWASAAAVFIDGQKIQEGDLFDSKCRLLLGSNLQPGQAFTFELKLNSPKHDFGALQTSKILIEYPQEPCDPGKLAVELAIIHTYLAGIAYVRFELEPIVTRLEDLLKTPLGQQSLDPLREARTLLLPLKQFFKERTIHVLGNAHIDIAWLWPIKETKEVLKRTFQSALKLQKNYPGLIFNQSSALTYEWIEQEEPELFSEIQRAVGQNQWELTGGMWIEPDLNLPSGESLIRQILYGKQYFQNKFNKDIKIAWNPDSFGFSWQLPQILVKSGFEAFITQKLAWNDTNKFPYKAFQWQGLDGTQILTYFSNEIGQGFEPLPIAKDAAELEQKHGLKQTLWLYGVGDHGGGPTADMLDLAEEWQQSDLFFQVKPQTAEDFIQKLKEEISDHTLPLWKDELYLEFHRGTFTTKADQKRKNRKLEVLISNTEKLCSLANLSQKANYPKHELENTWKNVLLNQFHDILPGSSIPKVFEDANLVWKQAEQSCRAITQKIGSKLSESMDLWNFHSFPFTGIVEIQKDELLAGNSLYIQGHNSHKAIPFQKTEAGIIFYAHTVPSLGNIRYKFIDISFPHSEISALKVELDTLENQYLKVTLDPSTGDIKQILDKRTNTELLSSPSTLQFFKDSGQYWDAWNIDPQYEQKQLFGLTLQSWSIQEEGPLRVSIKSTRQFKNSIFQQEILLDAYSPKITVKNWVDWQEEHILVKACFPLTFSASFATYEIPMGVIHRSTEGEEAKVKFEVPAQAWADLSGAKTGFSLLNDCKYGYDAKPSQLRLTLLRSPTWPDPNSDRGFHEFIYQLVPHQGSWKEAAIVQQAHFLNNPVQLYPSFGDDTKQSFLSTASQKTILTAFKRAEDGKSWIIRLYESLGQDVQETIYFPYTISKVHECNLMEHSIQALLHHEKQFDCSFKPYEIKTFSVVFQDI